MWRGLSNTFEAYHRKLAGCLAPSQLLTFDLDDPAEAVADRMRSFLGCSSDCETDAKALGHMMNVRWHGRNSSVAAYR